MEPYVPMYVQSMAIITRELSKDGLHKQIQNVSQIVSHNADILGDEVNRITQAPLLEQPVHGCNGKEEAVSECDFLIRYLESALDRTTRIIKCPEPTAGNAEATAPTYCVCNKPYDDDMVACDNPKCTVEWFHLRCVGLDHFPSGKWLCPACR